MNADIPQQRPAPPQRVPLPAGYEPHEVAHADQRHALVRQTVNAVVGQAATFAAGHEVTGAGALLRFATGHVRDAVVQAAGGCTCDRCCALAGLLVAAELALRAGGALHAGGAGGR